MMEYAIIAAGEGSRLKREGLTTPKPLLTLHETPMIERLIRLFAAQGAPQVHVIVNSHSPTLLDYLDAADFGLPVYTYVRDTPSSVHSLYELVKENRAWESCIVTTTDTVFSQSDFDSYCKAFIADTSVDAYMGVTSFVDDESPLFIAMDEGKHILHFADKKIEGAGFVSGGVYGLRKRAINAVEKCIEKGESRMRNYQRSLLAEGLTVKGHLFGKIVDVDHLTDRVVAEAFLTSVGEGDLRV